MTIRVSSLLEGNIHPARLEVELNSHVHIPNLTFVGLASPEIQEAKVRIQSAFMAMGLEFPRKKLVVNFAPADLRKLGTHLDLAIATAIFLSEYEEVKPTPPIHYFAAGECSLSGRFRSNRKRARCLMAAHLSRADVFICVPEDLPELERLYLQYFMHLHSKNEKKRLQFLPVRDLRELALALKNGTVSLPLAYERVQPQSLNANVNAEIITDDLSEILLPKSLHHALCLAIGGHHHLLISGPKGQGKSFALSCVEKIGNALRSNLHLESILIQELTREDEPPLFPVRKVGSHVRPATLLGRATSDRVEPGEFSRAHEGFLLADEFLEWPRDTMESFREPLESGTLQLSRAGKTVSLPAAFLLIAAANQCPCGGYQSEAHLPYGEPCRCNVKDVIRYRARLSGPVRDRIYLNVIWNGDDPRSLDRVPLTRTVEIIQRMRREQTERKGTLNGRLSSAQLKEWEKANPEWERHQTRLNFSNYRKKVQTQRLGLTVASFRGKEIPDFTDFKEAATLLESRD